MLKEYIYVEFRLPWTPIRRGRAEWLTVVFGTTPKWALSYISPFSFWINIGFVGVYQPLRSWLSLSLLQNLNFWSTKPMIRYLCSHNRGPSQENLAEHPAALYFYLMPTKCNRHASRNILVIKRTSSSLVLLFTSYVILGKLLYMSHISQLMTYYFILEGPWVINYNSS